MYKCVTTIRETEAKNLRENKGVGTREELEREKGIRKKSYTLISKQFLD